MNWRREPELLLLPLAVVSDTRGAGAIFWTAPPCALRDDELPNKSDEILFEELMS